MSKYSRSSLLKRGTSSGNSQQSSLDRQPLSRKMKLAVAVAATAVLVSVAIGRWVKVQSKTLYLDHQEGISLGGLRHLSILLLKACFSDIKLAQMN